MHLKHTAALVSNITRKIIHETRHPHHHQGKATKTKIDTSQNRHKPGQTQTQTKENTRHTQTKTDPKQHVEKTAEIQEKYVTRKPKAIKCDERK